jgi:signal transduction histidine kinase
MLTSNEIFLLQLHRLGSELIEGSDLRKSLSKVLETARKLLYFNRVYLFVENRDQNLIEVLMAVGKHSFIAKSLKWPRPTMGGPTYVFSKGVALIQHGLKDRRITKYYPKKTDDYDVLMSIYKLGKFGTGDFILAPVTFRGRTVAVLGADKYEQKLTKDDLQHVKEFASQIGWAIENARLREENQAVMKHLETLIEKRTEELKEIKTQLIHSERLAAMGELIAGITHEIKNPLTGILGFTELLKGYFQDKDDDAKQVLNGLITSINHLQSVVKNFLSYAKRGQSVILPCDINQIIADSLALTRHNLQKKKIEVQLKLTSENVILQVDRHQLIQVLTNMIMNAEDAMPDGGTLTISSIRNEGNVLIKIADTGIGIPEENQEKIFSSFFTTKGDNGTGLGLSVCKNIIEGHGGQILLNSAPKEGTTFTILLPLRQKTATK